MAELNDFWEMSETTGFKWGHQDCLTWPALYCLAITGIDPASRYRGTYSTKFGARRLLLQNGGFLNLACKSMQDFQSGCFKDGVGLIQNKSKICGAVLVDGAAYLKSDNGVSNIKKPEIIKAWSIWLKR